ncbi:MAG: DUF4874 domain-containing protein [Oscillospiraceae bacterium]|nr:DUF4874 domain-containing protein [Oscillospiraceae bacterium]
MRRIIIAVLAALGVLAAAAAAAAFFCFSHTNVPQTRALTGKELPALTSTSETANVVTAFALPCLAPENARPLLRNPDRGLRMETYITLGEPPESYPENRQDPYEKLLGFIEKYEEESPTVVQLYVYLTRYNDRPLDETAFAQLERMLELCRDNGVRALLRFAYQNESCPDPDWPRMKEHLNQLGEWFRANGQLLEDSLFVMQAGLVGYWGEGHSSVNFKQKYIGDAFDLLCRITPEDIFVQVRTIDLYNTVSREFRDRLGMHDDYIIGEMNGAWSFFTDGNDRKAKALEERFKRTINDAELPWGCATYYDRADGHPLDSMDALPIFQQFKQYSLTTLSLEHNYREAGPEHVYSMARWRDEYITAAQLDEAGLPYHPVLLGESGCVSVFEYIAYHLGYLLSVTSFELDTESRSLRFTVQNNGFAAPLNFNALSVVIDGEEYIVDSYDKYALGSMQAVTYTAGLPESFDHAREHRIGVKLAHREGSAICARFMNDTEFADGVQFF